MPSRFQHIRPQGAFGGEHAIVVGASTTGLVAAAAAARHFDRVTVLDRDRLPVQPEWRKGVPQGRHVHSLLKGGQNVMNHFLPGLSPHMLAHGAAEVDLGADVVWHHAGGWKKRFSAGIRMQCQSKAFLEWHVRQRVEALPNVGFRSLSPVSGLVESSGRIRGVRLEDGSTLEAELVVDASGRGSQTPRHLEQLGLASPPVTELPVNIGYASQIFEPPQDPRDWLGVLIHSSPPATRTAALMPIEGGRWIVTLVGWNGDLPPGEMAGFLEWARGLPVRTVYDAIARAQPVDRVWRWNFPSNLRRHYERLRRPPDGLVVVGDANTSLNPIYAQGMSQGAIGASLLDACLEWQSAHVGRGKLSGLSAHFFRRYASFLDDCWMTSTAEDFAATGPGGQRAWYAPALTRYLHHLARATWRDEAVARAFLEVMNLQRRPTSLMRPRIAWKALTATGQPSDPQPPPRPGPMVSASSMLSAP